MWQQLREEIRQEFFVPRKSIGNRDSPVRLRNEPQSDAVDVRGEDGGFQQGRIVDCAKGGLLIDLEGEEKPRFVPFGEIYLHEESLKRDVVFEGREIPVEVMMRRRPSGTKAWYPGTLIAKQGRYGSVSVSYCLVETAGPDGARIEVVSVKRIRRPLAEDVLNTLRVTNGHFVKQRLYLAKLFRHGPAFAQDMLDVLNRKSQLTSDRTRTLIRAVRMDGKSLTCIRIGYDIVPKEQQNHSSDSLRKVLLGAANDCITPHILQSKRMMSESDSESETESELPSAEEPAQKNMTEASAVEPDTSTDTCNIKLLPRNILACIFEQFDSAEQCRLRPVCAVWNLILTRSYIVRVRYEDSGQDLESVASLHHGWTAETRIIVNAGLDAPNELLLCGGRLFRTLVHQCRHLPVETLILADITWQVTAGRSDSFADFFVRFVEELNDMTVAGHNLLLRNVRVTIRSQTSPLKAAVVHIVTARTSGLLSVNDLWTRMNASLPDMADIQRQQLSDWITTNPERRYYHQYYIVQVLNDRQTGVDHRGREWTTADLDTLDLRKLSKLTLHSLAALKSSTTLTIPLSW